MSSFLAVIGKRGPVAPDIFELVPSLAAVALPFRHRRYRSERWQSVSGRTALFAWADIATSEPERSPIYERGATAIAKGGYVTHPSIADGFDLTSIASSVNIDSETVRQLGGAFALLRADGESDTVSVWNAVTRLVSVFFAENDDLFVIGSGALLVSMVRTGRAQPEYEPANLVPYLSSGYFASEQTPYRGVHTLMANSRLTASTSGVAVEPIDDFDLECGTVVPTSVFYDELADRLKSAMGQFGSAPIVCALTGGKDSRLVAAALHAAGAGFRTQTRGFPDDPDVVVAARIAGILGVEHANTVPPSKEAEGLRTMTIDVLGRARQTLFATDGMLSAYERVELANSFRSWPIRVGGAGGESLRGGFAKGLTAPHDITWVETRRWLYDRFLGHCEFLEPLAVVAYEAFLNEWIEWQQELEMRPVVALDTFYLTYRTGRWKASARASRHGASDWEPLTDSLITKAGLRAHENAKLNDELIYEVLKRLAPQLIDVPFANKRWEFEKNGPLPGRDDEWQQRAPVTSAQGRASSFDWRQTVMTELYDVFYDQIFNDRRATGLFDVVERRKLEQAMLKQRGKIVSKSRFTFYWAVYTASVLLSNSWLDREGEPRSVSFSIPVPEHTSSQ